MKQILLAILFFIVSFTGFAQESIVITPDTVFINHDDEHDAEIIAHSKVRNVSSVDKNLRWVKYYIETPDEWQVAICDPKLCYLPSKDSADFVLPPNIDSTLDIHVRPNNVAGNGEVQIKVYEIDNPANFTIGVYYLNIGTAGVDEVQKQNIIAYPNPTFDYINITHGSATHTIRIYNLLGKVVAIYNANLEGRYNISDLNQGIYLAGLFDRNNRIIKTLRISKRSLMP